MKVSKEILVEKIILQTSVMEEIELKNGAKVAYRVIGQVGFKSMITQICELIPEEGEVIAEGEVSISIFDNMFEHTHKIDNVFIGELGIYDYKFLEKFRAIVGKKGKLIFINSG